MVKKDMLITSDDILGKQAVDSEGEILGVITKLHINNEQKTLLGLTVDQGIFRPDLFIGIDYVDRFGVDIVFLKEVMVEKYKRFKLYTSDGKKIGYVRRILSQKNSPKKIIVTRSINPFKKQTIEIPISEVSDMGYSIILKNKWSEFYNKYLEEEKNE